MRRCLILALTAVAVHGAVIRGTVVENQTGHPLARALVALDPVAGSAGSRHAVRTNSYGSFEFLSVPAGAYLVTASRTGFATTQYGQKQWKSSGVPVSVAEADAVVLAIRLPRFGSITGTVLDENDVGLPEYEVVAYRNTRPPQLAARVKSDDRGMFRLFGLEPGSYLVRSAAKLYDETEYLPTFSKETQNVDQAYPVEVNLDQQVERADVRVLAGHLFSLIVDVVTVPPNAPLPVTITLVSEMGRETVQASRSRFASLPPGQYELFATAPLDRRPGIQGLYQRISISRDTELRFVLYEVPELEVTLKEAQPKGAVQVLSRRKDLAGEGAPELLKLVNNKVQLAPGPWELALLPIHGFYVSSFSGPTYGPRAANAVASGTHFEGWNEISVGSGGAAVNFVLSSNAGALHGTVKSSGDPVAGAPVFLEPVDLEPRKRLTNTYTARTDVHGNYQFADLAPGNYRVLSSFEYQMPDSETMTNAGAKAFTVDPGSDSQQDLDLYIIR